uniref:Ice-binding protein isoform 1 n=1 Tax=Pyramimonas gelidicola TaxID=471943 RepID=I3UIH3_9CHLO|nr:ice-binding protein isoform 1 [Pyramimonas gelidicola]
MVSALAYRSLFVLALALGGASARTLLQEPTPGPNPARVNLLTAEDYVILAKTGISTVPTSVITGDIAVSPIAGAAMTGFSITLDIGEQFATSDQVVGQGSNGNSKMYAASYNAPTPSHLTTAVSAMEAAYTDAAGRTNADGARINTGGGILGSEATSPGGSENPLTRGIYTFQSGVRIDNQVTFDGSATDIFIIQMTGDLLVFANINLINGARAENIFWQVAGSVEIEAGVQMKGVLLVKTEVKFKTGSSLNGRVLSQTACVLDHATITKPDYVV